MELVTRRHVPTFVAPEHLRAVLLKRLDDAQNDQAVARDIGISRHTLVKLACGRPCLAITIMATAAKLGVDIAGVPAGARHDGR